MVSTTRKDRAGPLAANGNENAEIAVATSPAAAVNGGSASVAVATTDTIPAKLRRRHTSIHSGDDQESVRDNAAAAPKVDSVSFFCGLTAGVIQAGLFNPFDRALYLSVKNEVPFLRKENFQNPYQGFFQSVGHRALSGGLYYPLEQYFMTLIPPPKNISEGDSKNAFYHFLAGTAAGSANAFIINPISAIKYKTWGRDVNRGMLREVFTMVEKGGMRPFFNGLYPTMLRDLVFGGCYTFLRLELQYRWNLTSETQWTANVLAAALATVASGPFNLARNMQYATKSAHVADSVRVVLANLWHETVALPTASAKWHHVQQRLRIGWGTARVAVGMAFGHAVYDYLHGWYNITKQQIEHGDHSYPQPVQTRQTQQH